MIRSLWQRWLRWRHRRLVAELAVTRADLERMDLENAAETLDRLHTEITDDGLRHHLRMAMGVVAIRLGRQDTDSAFYRRHAAHVLPQSGCYRIDQPRPIRHRPIPEDE